MSIRFRKTIKILPGVKINIGKTGISTSVGVRGAHVTVGKRGTHATVGIPGSGLSVTKRIGGKSQKSTAKEEIQSPPVPKLSTKEIQMRVRAGDGRRLFMRGAVAVAIGCLVWYFINLPCGIGAAAGLFFAMYKALEKEIAQRPLPGIYESKEAAQVALLNVLKAIHINKLENKNKEGN